VALRQRTAGARCIEPSGFTKVSALGVEEQRVNVILDLVDPTGEDVALGDAYRVDVRIVVWAAAEVVQGLREGERVVVHPPDSLADGGRVAELNQS
jgi:hypothetical protein